MDAAYAFAAVEAAREYGIVVEWPAVDLGRCSAILEEGKALGVVPSHVALGRLLAELCAGRSAHGSDDGNRDPA
ncbi:MAG: hypothetical protein ACYDCI_00420 [Candidatus Limnocylindrales bacterium]